MTCEQARLDLHAYFDRELDPARHRAMERHLDDCADCRRRVSALGALSDIIRMVPAPPAPERLRSRIAAILNRWTAVRRLRAPRRDRNK